MADFELDENGEPIAFAAPVEQKGKFRCRGCGYRATSKWLGKCPGCRRYYNIVAPARGRVVQSLSDLALKPPTRHLTGLKEFDRILGGGLVQGSSMFITGEAGAGKSTLLMQVISFICKATGRDALYTSDEQNNADIGLIAQRVGALDKHVAALGNEGNIFKIVREAEVRKPVMLVVDSIQTAFMEDIDSDVGSARQLEGIANYLSSFSKRKDVVTCIVGHRNKDGEIAGPEKVKHLVDVVVYIDKVPYNPDEDPPETKGLRDIWCGKNRYGEENVHEIVRMMKDGSGLRSLVDEDDEPPPLKSKFLTLVQG